MTIEILTAVFGWSAIINIGVILLMVVMFAVIDKEGFPFTTTARLFGTSVQLVRDEFFRIFMQFRMLVFVFNIVPWIALEVAA